MIQKRTQITIASSFLFLFLFLIAGCDRNESLPAQEPAKNQEIETEETREPQLTKTEPEEFKKIKTPATDTDSEPKAKSKKKRVRKK